MLPFIQNVEKSASLQQQNTVALKLQLLSEVIVAFGSGDLVR